MIITKELITVAVALISLIFSFISLYLSFGYRMQAEKKHEQIDDLIHKTKDLIDDLDTSLFHTKEDLLDLKSTFYKSGIETLKVHSEDHELSIESLRKDLLDLQVISGTLPSRAGTMLDEVNNALTEMKALQSAYKEQQAVIETAKEQIEKLAAAYSSLHFTGKEIEEMRDTLEELKKGAA